MSGFKAKHVLADKAYDTREAFEAELDRTLRWLRSQQDAETGAYADPIGTAWALAAFATLARTEGILPALESSHAVAGAMQLARGRSPDEAIIVCLSGRGDKDAAEIARLTGGEETK